MRSTSDSAGQMVAALALLFGETMSADRLTLYVFALEDVPTAQLKAGCARAMRTRTWFPKPAELRADVDAMVEVEREAAQRQALEAERTLTRGPFTVFGRMSKAAVQQRFGRFMADTPCECVACLTAHVEGPPRFVPDGVHPDYVCPRCQDTGVLEVPGSGPGVHMGVRRCACHGTNPQLREATRCHTIEMGRWLHGDELRAHEQAQAAFHAALRRVGVHDLAATR
jgi:hypothetical protein